MLLLSTDVPFATHAFPMITALKHLVFMTRKIDFTVERRTYAVFFFKKIIQASAMA